MKLVNIDYIPGKELEVLGIVKGTVVQSKNFGKDFMAGMKTLVGGEITGYTEMLNEPGRLPPSAWWTRRKQWEPMRSLIFVTGRRLSCRARQR